MALLCLACSDGLRKETTTKQVKKAIPVHEMSLSQLDEYDSKVGKFDLIYETSDTLIRYHADATLSNLIFDEEEGYIQVSGDAYDLCSSVIMVQYELKKECAFGDCDVFRFDWNDCYEYKNDSIVCIDTFPLRFHTLSGATVRFDVRDLSRSEFKFE